MESLTSAVDLYSGRPFDDVLADALSGRRWVLVTTKRWVQRLSGGRILDGLTPAAAVLDGVEANPTVASIYRLAEACPECDVVVALGGGSTIDSAKGVLALRGLDGNRDPFEQHLREGAPLAWVHDMPELIAVPTTSGTGSEVTPWGTLWGDDGHSKYSVSDPRLVPTAAILDPSLCVSMPRGLTLATGLDAVSHALEAVWNVHHTPMSDAFAELALRKLRAFLGAALGQPENVEVRAQVQVAACLGGLAMGTTKTALAHSISYPLTSRLGVPHGLACSFTLPEVARYNLEQDPRRFATIASALEVPTAEVPSTIERWFDELGISETLQSSGEWESLAKVEGQLINPSRAANNLRPVDESAAMEILHRATNRFVHV